MAHKKSEMEKVAELYNKNLARIMDAMRPLKEGATLKWVPLDYNLKIAANAPKLRRGKGVDAGKYFLDPLNMEYVAIIKEANVQGRTYYLLAGGRLVNAKFCCDDGKQHEALPGVKK